MANGVVRALEQGSEGLPPAPGGWGFILDLQSLVDHLQGVLVKGG